ncbi:efflux RND transporter periplasmic adaptor subunit [Shewanella algae]|uniref:efflux RND transporter periplasmic adaptor subunit n=1 Tax=Shewanella algae TaxID=38313 RepID=UPI001AADEC54|nr:efflux RND transporter periplasmic adaptor subunit [Shewanella algae]MBO2674439.1 efflux RND transporter periplasmic adaptor subunit [Shewanella algae]
MGSGALVVTLTLLLSLSACQPQPSEHSETKPPVVNSANLVLKPGYTKLQQFSGSIRAGNTTGIGFELAGKLQKLLVDTGDRVKPGQLLAQLDTSLLEAEQTELQAALDQNQADISLARATLKRSLELSAKQYLSEQQLDELKGKLASLEAGHARLEASLKANELKRQKSLLIAPFAGVIAAREHNLGEVIALGSPVFTLVQSDNLQALIGVPLNIAEQLQPGAILNLRVAEHYYQAQLQGISGQINPVTRTVQLRFSITPTSETTPINGELAYLQYRREVPREGYWVPVSALTDGIRGLWNLYVLKQDVEGFKLQRRDVEILYTEGDNAFITGAISPGEQFVTTGLHKLVAGQRVSPGAALTARGGQ